jgi:hypothetical protein
MAVCQICVTSLQHTHLKVPKFNSSFDTCLSNDLLNFEDSMLKIWMFQEILYFPSQNLVLWKKTSFENFNISTHSIIV